MPGPFAATISRRRSFPRVLVPPQPSRVLRGYKPKRPLRHQPEPTRPLFRRRQTDLLSLDKFKILLDDPMVICGSEMERRFNALRTSGQFNQTPSHELLQFARELADAVDMSCMDGGSDLPGWGQRIMYLKTLVETNASTTTTTSLLDQDQVEALATRAQAFIGDYTRPKQYIADRAETEGRCMVESEAYFETSHFYQVLTTIVMSLCVHESWEASVAYLFEASYPRWKQINMGVDKFLVDDKLAEILGHFCLGYTLEYVEDWDTNRRQELFDFVLTAMNGSRNYDAAQSLIWGLHHSEQACPPSLVVETIQGLLSESRNEWDRSRYQVLTKKLFRILPPDVPDYATLKHLIASQGEAKKKTPLKKISGPHRP